MLGRRLRPHRPLAAVLLVAATLFGGCEGLTPATAATTFPDFSSNNTLPNVALFKGPLVALKANDGGPGNYCWFQTCGSAALTVAFHKAGKVVWHYDFMEPGYCNTNAMYACGQAEAGQLIREVTPTWKTGDRLVGDFEIACIRPGVQCRNPQQLSDFLKGWLTTARTSKLDTKPILYSYFSFMNQPGVLVQFSTAPVWIAAYQSSYPNHPQLHQVIAWQDSDHTWNPSCKCYADSSVLLSALVTPTPIVAKPTPVKPGPCAKYPVPKFDVNLRKGSHAAGSAVQWVQCTLHRNTGGSLARDPGLTKALLIQQAGWGLKQTAVVDSTYVAKAKVRGCA